MKNPLLRDAPEHEKHLRLKRWERMVQFSAWKRRREEEGTLPLPCPWRTEPAVPMEMRPARLLEIFPGDLVLVRYVPTGPRDSEIFMVRGGLPWPTWFAQILRAYLIGAVVPHPFLPQKRLPPEWIRHALAWPAPAQAAWFEKLRATGLLPPLAKLDAKGVAPWMRWEEVRSRFLDFQ